jgi:hypothetical protein
METNTRWFGAGAGPSDDARHRTETEWVLSAIAGAISAGRLPPNDAFAWARIAASEAKQLGAARADRRAA